jgi:hypothetical protein
MSYFSNNLKTPFGWNERKSKESILRKLMNEYRLTFSLNSSINFYNFYNFIDMELCKIIINFIFWNKWFVEFQGY